MPEIIIDTRESGMQSGLNALKIPFIIQNLDVGDILIKMNGQNAILIERKTYSDLANAIQTGRHDEQKARIHAYDCQVKCYLIEDPIQSYTKGIPQSSLDSAVLGLAIRDGFYTIHSRDLNMTCRIIQKLYEKFDEYIKDRESIQSGNLKYNGPIYSIRKDNLTPDSCYIAQLSCYPGISHKIAEVISKKYRTFNLLFRANQLDLEDLEISTETGKTRRLGIPGKNLYNYLHNRKEEPVKKIVIINKKQG